METAIDPPRPDGRTTSSGVPSGFEVDFTMIGGALALAAWTGFMRAARMLRSNGTFDGLASLVPYAAVDGLFAGDLHERYAHEG